MHEHLYADAVAQLQKAVDAVPANLAERIKSASTDCLIGTDPNPLQYADPHTRRFPLHSPDAVLTSLARVKVAAEELGASRVDAYTAVLMARANAFGIRAEAERVAGEAEKQAEATDPLPVNLGEAAAAVDQVFAYPGDFTLEYKTALARRVVGRFPEVAGDRRETLEKWAGYGWYDPERVAASLHERAVLCKTAGRADAAVAYAETGVMLLEGGRLKGRDMAKLACMVEAMDREHGLLGFDGVLPATAFFDKAATELEKLSEDLVETKAGTVFSKQAAVEVDRDRLKAVFGEQAYDAMCDDGLFLNPAKVAAAIENADKKEDRLWRQVLRPVA